MIATGLVFLLGMLVAALVSILIAPLVWRKAQRLARRDMAATLPASANEIRAEFDRVRAEAAMELRRGEIDVAAARERIARSQAELGRTSVENAKLRKQTRRQEERLAELAAEVDTLRAQVRLQDETASQQQRALAEARRDAELNAEELEALGKRYKDAVEAGEAGKLAETLAAERVAGLASVLERAERQATADRQRIEALSAEAERRADERRMTPALAGAVAALAETLRPGTPAPRPAAPIEKPVAPAAPVPVDLGLDPDASPAVLRERILDVAAHVIHVTALAEGEGSPLAPLLQGAPRRDGAPADLAERVRRLADAPPQRRERRAE